MKLKKLQAFTLVELLVVIAIITMLLAVLMPALNKARQQSQRVACLSNMRQMGLVLTTYLIDSENHLPPSSCHLSNPQQYWLCILNKYSKSPLLYRCPSDKTKLFVDWSKPLNAQSADARWSSFALNVLLDPDCYLYNGIYNRTIRIKRADKCIYICECPDSWKNADHLHPEQWESLDYAKGFVAWDRHLKTSNYVFADGHAENLKLEKTWDYPTINYWLPDSAPGWPKN